MNIKTAAIAACPLAVLFAHSYGPPPNVTGAPGDSPLACTQCHSGHALNSGTGSVQIILPGGPVYIPGVKQRVTVQVSDPTQMRWGFELSARLNSNLRGGQAGDFAPIDNFTQVICQDNGPLPCASGVSFVEHTSAGTRNGTKGGAAFQFDWNPPATADAGPVTLYVAGNAANGNGQDTGDLIYTSSVQLTPLIPSMPSLTSGGVVNAATLAPGAVGPNSWVTIYGANLGVTTRSWTNTDFVNGEIPFSLDGVSVLLSSFGELRLAYVGYVSPTQVNFLLPSDFQPGQTTVEVRNPAGISNTLPVTVQNNAPQLFTLDGTNVFATHADGTYVSPSAPAAAGEAVTLYGSGLGVTNPAMIPGQLPATAARLVTLPQVTIGGATAAVSAASVVPEAAGLYEIDVQIPSNAASGSLAVVVKVGTASSASTMITVR